MCVCVYLGMTAPSVQEPESVPSFPCAHLCLSICLLLNIRLSISPSFSPFSCTPYLTSSPAPKCRSSGRLPATRGSLSCAIPSRPGLQSSSLTKPIIPRPALPPARSLSLGRKRSPTLPLIHPYPPGTEIEGSWTARASPALWESLAFHLAQRYSGGL